MGNTASNARERHKSGDLEVLSSHRESPSQAFIFDKKTACSSYQEQSGEDDESDNKHLSVINYSQLKNLR